MSIVVSLWGNKKLVVSGFSGVVTDREYDEPCVLGAELCGSFEGIHDWVRCIASEVIDDPSDSKCGLVSAYNKDIVREFMERKSALLSRIVDLAALLRGGVEIEFGGVKYVLCQELSEFNGSFVGRGYELHRFDEVQNDLLECQSLVCEKSEFFNAFFGYWT